MDRLWDILTRSFDGDVVVLFEVDACVLLGWVVDGGTEELPLQAGVGRARDMLAVPPLSIAGAAASGLTATAAAAGVAFVASTGIATTSATPTATTVDLEGRGSVVAVRPVAWRGAGDALAERGSVREQEADTRTGE